MFLNIVLNTFAPKSEKQKTIHKDFKWQDTLKLYTLEALLI